MINAPRFSVVVPCYNSAETIVSTLESVLQQTRQDFEIIVVDDGSKDDSAEKVAALAQRDRRITLIRQSNAGVSRARNRGVEASRGGLIALLDADDLWDARFLEIHAERFNKDAALGLSFSAVRFIDAQGRDTGEFSRSKLSGLTAVEILSTNPCTTCSSIVVRRQVFDDAGSFDASLRRAEDQEWLFRVALTSWKIEGVSSALVSYRNSASGLSANLDAMYEGFSLMLARARRKDPTLVDRAAPLASARMSRYLARRALRLQHGRSMARRFMMRALRLGPGMILSEPKQTLATLAAAFVPGCDFLFRTWRKA